MLSFVLQFFFFHFPFLATGSGAGCYGEKETLSWRLGAPICMGALYRLVLRRKPNIKRETQTEDRGGNPWWTWFQMQWLSSPPWENLATADVEREMTHVSGSRAQWQSTDLFLMLTSPVFVGITFVCVLGCRYKWQIFPPPPRENNSVPACCIPVTMAVPDFLVCSGTGWRLQSQKRSKSLLNVFSLKGPLLVASRFRPLALFVTSRHRAQQHMKLSQSHSLNLQSFENSPGNKTHVPPGCSDVSAK